MRPAREAGRQQRSVGVGLRLDLPIGPLKIDYGIPLQKDNNTNGPKVQFSVGYQF